MNVVRTGRFAAIRHSGVLVKWPACHGALGERDANMFLEHKIVLHKMFRILKTTSRPILREQKPEAILLECYENNDTLYLYSEKSQKTRNFYRTETVICFVCSFQRQVSPFNTVRLEIKLKISLKESYVLYHFKL
jgi:hypothetical protein